MTRFIQRAVFALLVRPFFAIVLGVNIRGRDRLPLEGPAIIVANHNSHLDTLTIMSLLPLSRLHLLRPVAAMDYFMKSRLLAWFATKVIHIIPIDRGTGRNAVSQLAACKEALDRGEILILYPEGTRGEPEKIVRFKRGIAHLAKARPDAPIYPLFHHGLGKALPKGSYLLVPFVCDLVVGEPMKWTGSIPSFAETLEGRIKGLAGEINMAAWE